jgi:hypothetical protein
VIDEFDHSIADEVTSSSFMRKTSQPFKFTGTRVPINLMNEFVNDGPLDRIM